MLYQVCQFKKQKTIMFKKLKKNLVKPKNILS